MNRFCKVTLYLVLLVIILILYYVYYLQQAPTEASNQEPFTSEPQKYDVNLAVVACSDRVKEALHMLKSALMLSKSILHFFILTEDHLVNDVKNKLNKWMTLSENQFDYQILPITYPVSNPSEWYHLFAPCASQRLFLPVVLKDVDSVLYVDSDTLFLTPVENVWQLFYKMNSSQMVALALEQEPPTAGWYDQHSTIPFVRPTGLNSGVMFMNLTRMRQFQWVDHVVYMYEKYKSKLTWADQDIINLICYYHPDILYLCSCRYNYRTEHCQHTSTCKSAEKEGVAILHGSRKVFHPNHEAVFMSIYEAVEQIGDNLYNKFYQPLQRSLELTRETTCGHVRDIFLKNVLQDVNN